MPNAFSTIPPRAMFPANWNTWVPWDRPMPRPAYSWAPRAMIDGTLAMVSTLFTTVGAPKRPSRAGIGGLARTMPRLPSMLSNIAVSSPHTYEPAPTRTSTSKVSIESRMRSPSHPSSRAMSIARCMVSIASGYSERM